MNLKIFGAFLAVMALSACGSGSSGGPGGSARAMNTSNLSGSYAGQESGSTGGQPFGSTGLSVTLSQDGYNVSGAYSTSQGETGTITATYSGGGLSNATVQQSGNCSGTMTASFVVTSSGISGTIAGNTACGYTSATVDLSPQ